MTPAEVLGLIKEKEVKFVDFRFTDTKGKEQHVTVPSHTVDEDLFEEGKMFDGSSIAGWKGINESDMILMPDPASAVVDIFTDEVTMNLRCKNRPASRTPLSSGRRTSFSSSITSPGTIRCRARSTRLTPKKAPGTRTAASKRATPGTAQR
jgi:glutamine synthetase